MSIRPIASLAATLVLLAACAATISQDGLEQRTAQAIGRTVGQFAITDRREETGGRINYAVSTRDGAAYRCYLYGATGLQNAVTFGQTPHSDAICTPVASGQRAGGNERPAATGQRGRSAGGDCNALLRAAGRC
ncbi:hypothetical protein HB662_21490 [Roseomonas frigidaquae]|uniref:Lipoprotein n=1 Tax=Falsiroseomonas frigidaquae TaxID=487318 RepID=A0ABX1F4R6_9PROT|nr:hypothetical protein [Falsiroseomonas frigidaquae]NKE47366.1 hypothetical protein [Falsiroseomonas frigidaquae]